MNERIIIGSDTHNFESVELLTGIQRVVHDLHVGLVDRLSPRGIDLVPLHIRSAPRQVKYRNIRYLADDPVLDRQPRFPDEVDAILLLDVAPGSDYGPLHRSLQKRPRPVIAIVYDILPLKKKDIFDVPVRNPFRLYLQQVLKLADHIVVTSRHVEDDLRSLGWRFKGQIHVLPLGSTFSPRRPDPPIDDRLSMLYVSTIEPRKGHGQLVEAFNILRQEGLDVDLTIIGRRGWDSTSLINSWNQHPDFETRLSWLGSPDDLILRTHAQRSSIGVCPSMDEGFGLFVEEGLALGLKMVVSDIPVFRERLYTNMIFSKRDPASLARAILAAHRSPWIEPTTPIRLMSDFVEDFFDLITQVIKIPVERTQRG